MQAISNGYYQVDYRDGPIYPSCPIGSAHVVLTEAVQSSNCNPYTWTATDLACMNALYATDSSTPSTHDFQYWGDGASTCVNVGDRCFGVVKENHFRFVCK